MELLKHHNRSKNVEGFFSNLWRGAGFFKEVKIRSGSTSDYISIERGNARFKHENS